MTTAPDADAMIDGFVLEHLHDARRFIVVSTQGKGDEAALKAALGVAADYRAFVGSRRKMASLREKLLSDGIEAAALDSARRRPASISARSRLMKSLCRSLPKSRSNAVAGNAVRAQAEERPARSCLAEWSANLSRLRWRRRVGACDAI